MYLTFKETTYVTDPGDQSGEPYTWQGSTGLELTLLELTLTKPDGYYVDYDLVDNALIGADSLDGLSKAWAVYAKYITGGTFGSSETWCLLSVRRNLEAATMDEAIAEQRQDMPWLGYFESLNGIEIVQLEIT